MRSMTPSEIGLVVAAIMYIHKKTVFTYPTNKFSTCIGVFGFDVFLGVRLHGHAVLAVQMFVDGHELVLHRLVALLA